MTKTFKNDHNQGVVKFPRLYVANSEEKNNTTRLSKCMVASKGVIHYKLLPLSYTINSLSLLSDLYYKISMIKN